MKKIMIIGLVILILLVPSVISDTAEEDCIIIYDSVYNEEEETYQGGYIFSPLDCREEFRFEDVEMVMVTEDKGNNHYPINISGKGKVGELNVESFEGKISFCDKYKDEIKGEEEDPCWDPLYIENGRNMVNGEWSAGYRTTAINEDIFYQTPLNKESEEKVISDILNPGIKISDQEISLNNYVYIEGAYTSVKELIISPYGIGCASCVFEIVGKPEIKIFGSTLSILSTGKGSSTKIILNGEEHIIGGAVQLEDGYLVIPEDEIGMVDGVYINARKSEKVTINLEGQTPKEEGNYLSLYNDYFNANGEGFKFTLGTGNGGWVSEDFDFEMLDQSRYISEGNDYGRLIFEMSGGELTAVKHQNTDLMKIYHKEGSFNYINGEKKFIYEGGPPRDMAYKGDEDYTNCKTDFLNFRSTTRASCGDTKGFDLVASLIKIQGYEDVEEEMVSVSLQKRESYSIDKNKVYLLNLEENREISKVGILYYSEEDWRIFDESGVKDFVESSFYESDIEIKEMSVDFPKEIIEEIEEKYELSYRTGKKVYYAAAGIYVSQSSELEDIEDVDSSTAKEFELYMGESSTKSAFVTKSIVSLVERNMGEEILSSSFIESS